MVYKATVQNQSVIRDKIHWVPWPDVLHGRSEVAEDTDVCKLLAVAVGVERQHDRPLQAHDAPNCRQVETVGVAQGWGGEDTHK